MQEKSETCLPEETTPNLPWLTSVDKLRQWFKCNKLQRMFVYFDGNILQILTVPYCTHELRCKLGSKSKS